MTLCRPHLFALVFAVPALAVSVFPTLGYSSSEGFVLGGTAARPFFSADSLSRGVVSLGAYYGTAGMVSLSAEAFSIGVGGGRHGSLKYERLMGRSWYGWGNNTHPDTTAEMDYERQSLSLALHRGLLPGLMIQAGVSVRHSSVYNREDSFLWERSQSRVYGSSWTAGPEIGLRYRTGRFGAGVSGVFQAGDAYYAGVTGNLHASFPLPGRMDGGVSITGSRHFGTDDTPLPYVPALGQSQGFRGYSDFRFTGPVSLLTSAEIRKMFLTIVVPLSDMPWRIGAAVFGDAGQVAESAAELAMRRFHIDAGAGLRILTHDNLMLKVDAGWGDEGLAVSAGIDHDF